MDYRVDTHLGSGPVTHTVDERRLIVTREKSGDRVVVPFSSITAINLRQDMPGAYMTIVHHQGGRAVTIPSRHFVAFGRFEDRGAEYVAFVGELHRAAHRANASIRFVAGSSLLFWAGALVAAMTAVLGLMFVYGMFVMVRPPPLRALLSVPLALAIAAGFLRQGRAKPYDPTHLPETLLPPT